MQHSPGPPRLKPVRRRAGTPCARSANRRQRKFRSIAQPAEHPVLTREVGGSTPSGPTKFCPCSPIGRGSRFKTGRVKVRILPRAPKDLSNPCKGSRVSCLAGGIGIRGGFRNRSIQVRVLGGVPSFARGICPALSGQHGSYRMARKRAVTPRLDEHCWFDSSTAHQFEGTKSHKVHLRGLQPRSGAGW